MEGQVEVKKPGFLNSVFDFDDHNKNLLLNLFQYSFLSIPFVIIILKLVNYYTPEQDDTKGTLVIVIEICTSISIILLSIWFINKIIRYIPTYSKMEYAVFNETNFIIPLFIILFTMQTKLGAKINTLIERLVDLYDGKTNLKEDEKEKKGDYKTTQPISQTPGHQPSRSDFISQQPLQPPMGQMQNQVANEMKHPGSAPTMPQHNFDNTFAGPNTPLVDAGEPMAANEAFGGMFGGSLF